MSPVTNYERGRAFEYERMKAFRDDGHEVMRTAGSHGKFDLIAISPKGRVQLIQCKLVSTEAEANRFIRNFIEYPPIPCGQFVQRIDVRVKGSRKVESGWT